MLALNEKSSHWGSSWLYIGQPQQGYQLSEHILTISFFLFLVDICWDGKLPIAQIGQMLMNGYCCAIVLIEL